ncbi:lipoprotein insertase outer membrane protein LolB [Silanimonas algicola]
MISRGFGLLLLLALAGCASYPGGVPPGGGEGAKGRGDTGAEGVAPPVDSPEAFAALAARDSALRRASAWSLTGRIAVARGNDGGTLGFSWTQRDEVFDLRLSAPVTGKQWRLRGSPGSATLEGLEGGPRQGVDAEALLLEVTGWRLPIRQLPDWVRGLRGAGRVSDLAIDGFGRPVGFRQDAWALSYRDWWPGDPPLPRRVFAETDGASVRLVVTEWGAVPADGVERPE